MPPIFIALLLATGQSMTAPAATTTNDSELSLVCLIQDWAPPNFVSSSDAARARLGDEDRKWIEQYEKSLREKSRERENGDISVTEFDRFVDRSFSDAARARGDLRPILEAISAKYSRSIGVDRLLTTNNERTLAEHEASKLAKPHVGRYMQLRTSKGLLTWQESLRRVIENAPVGQADARSELKPLLTTTATTITLMLARLPEGEAPRTIVTIDRYTGELLLERNRADGSLLYTLSGMCEKQAQPRF
ncbi:MAG: hypothetical protein QM769_09200 [Pseudoxanthomonas sp.]